MEKIDSEQSEEMISINRTFKNFFKLIITRTIMRTIIKGMTLLLAGVSFMACSKDVTFDENAQNQAKAEAELAQKFATYESDFGKTFGTVAAGHKWGFDQTTGITTRTAVTTTDDYWLIPENLWGGSQNKEGWNANSLHAMYVKMNQEGGMLSSVSDFSFDNYFLQHVEKVQGGQVKHSVAALEAYNSNTGNWEAVTNFEAGDNPSGTFQITAPNTDFFAPKNKSAAGTTLMANMGGNAYNNEDDADEYALDPDLLVYRVDSWEGLMDKHTGKVLTPAKYTDMRMISKDLIMAELDNGYEDYAVIMDRRGRIIKQ